MNNNNTEDLRTKLKIKQKNKLITINRNRNSLSFIDEIKSTIDNQKYLYETKPSKNANNNLSLIDNKN